MRATIDAEILVTPPSASSLTDVIPAEDIVSFTASEAAGREVSNGTLVLDASGGKYVAPEATGGATQLNIDDRLDIRVAWTGAARGDPFGQGAFGSQPFGDTAWRTAATVVVTGWEVSEPNPNTLLYSLDIENFVFNRLREQTVNEYRALDAPISGSEDAHLNSILADFAPEIDRSQLPTISEPIDYSVDKKTTNKVVNELARLAHNATGRSWILGSNVDALTMQALDDLTSQWTADDGQTDFEGQFTHSSAADDLVNEIRVEGGVDPDNIDDQQTTADAFTTVTSSTRLETRVDSRKSELPRIDMYVRENAGSDDDVRVRLQADDGAGNPIDPTNTDSDIINQRESVPSGQDGFLTFQLGEHTIAPRERPHLIIDSPGANGHDIGQDSGTDEPAYKVYFSKPVIIRIPDTDSQAQYREHDTTVSDENLRTFNAARERGRAELDRRAEPKLEFSTEAASERAHALNVADVVTLAYPERRATGDYVVTNVDHTYQGNLLQTTLELRSVAEFA